MNFTPRPLEARPYRVVEGQHVISTRKLVGSAEEQRVLEELLEGAKPSAQGDVERLHYLLATPFRYPPLRNGSRFGGRSERGIFYGAVEKRTALGEVAYYRLLFLAGTRALLARLEVQATVFRARVRAKRGLDLRAGEFAPRCAELTSKVDYKATQALGRELREASVQAFRYASARIPKGTCVAVLDPAAFAAPEPESLETWHMTITREAVEARPLAELRPKVLSFARELFLVEGQLPSAAV